MSAPISRRRALQTLAGAATLAAVARSASAIDTPAPSGPKQSVCRWCFSKFSMDELCEQAKSIGFQSVELLQPDEWPIAIKHGLTCAMAMGTCTIPDGFNRLENHARLVPEYIQRIKDVAAVGIPNLICFSGNRRGLDDKTGLENCATALRQITPAAERAGVTVCMELLNSRVNHPDYMCDHTPWGLELVQKVGSPRFKLLYDIYHMQIMEGDVIRTIRDHHDEIAHYHTAGNPGRHEFTSVNDVQEMNYTGIFRAIRETGYTGFIAHEFIPTREPFGALREAFELTAKA